MINSKSYLLLLMLLLLSVSGCATQRSSAVEYPAGWPSYLSLPSGSLSAELRHLPNSTEGSTCTGFYQGTTYHAIVGFTYSGTIDDIEKHLTAQLKERFGIVNPRIRRYESWDSLHYDFSQPDAIIAVSSLDEHRVTSGSTRYKISISIVDYIAE
jgi:hypothetical protein